MKKLLTITGLTLLSFAPKQQEKQLTVRLTVAEWNVVISGLGEMPLKVSGQLTSNIVNQLQKQLQDSTKKR